MSTIIVLICQMWQINLAFVYIKTKLDNSCTMWFLEMEGMFLLHLFCVKCSFILFLRDSDSSLLPREYPTSHSQFSFLLQIQVFCVFVQLLIRLHDPRPIFVPYVFKFNTVFKLLTESAKRQCEVFSISCD